ncbi:hypothetical protein ANANG_G00218360 [Anguilla anguilla]|uniref:IRS-type PTB domain-containing protein n=1 Tax=Anguilla anguilla TaxID=7936 RepID=A0A9D3LZQ4_ANGAN|nr:hypothetical protein ANANG_G00218360 [Anguilla anguilla]
MGGCWSCLYRDTLPENHPTKFKVTNVDDEGNELGSGTMELTQTELILHTRKRDAVRWPYLCLRRYGYDSNLFSFESGRRCQTGQGIFAFKCSRAEEIFNLLQELMQCNSINVVEEPVLITRSGHTPELDLPCTPQTPNTPAYTVQGFPNGYPGYPVSADSSHPSSGQPSVADEHGHSLMGLDEQAHTYVNTASVEAEIRGRHCVHSLPEVRPTPFPEPPRGVAPSMHCCPLEEREDPQVFLQTASQEAKFMLGPTPAQRRFLELERERRAHHSHGAGLGAGGRGPRAEPAPLPPPPTPPPPPASAPVPPGPRRAPGRLPAHPPHLREHQRPAGGRAQGGAGRSRACPASMSHSGGSSSSSSGGGGGPLPPPRPPPTPTPTRCPQAYGCERGCHRKTALLNYENLPSLPGVGVPRLQREEEEQDEEEEEEDDEEEEQEEDEEYEEEDYDEYEFSEGPGTPNGYHQDGDRLHGDDMRNYVNTERGRAGGCEHGHLPQPRQLNYIQVDLDGEPSHQDPAQASQLQPPAQPTRRSQFYAVIDLKKTAAMSNLQKAPQQPRTCRSERDVPQDIGQTTARTCRSEHERERERET